MSLFYIARDYFNEGKHDHIVCIEKLLTKALIYILKIDHGNGTKSRNLDE